MAFKLVSDFAPTGDQPQAIEKLTESILTDSRYNTLLGVTGSGKTFTMANVIARTDRPTLVLCHNKTLAAQLYGEFKSFFPDNAVEYFVSYYDYYQPEAYLPASDTYIEKDLSINEDIEKMRLSTTSTLLSGRRDVIVVSSVSCLYGMGNPDDFSQTTIEVHCGKIVGRKKFLYSLIDALYSRNEVEFKRGTFRVKGDTINVFPAYGDIGYRIVFFDEEIEMIQSFDPLTGAKISDLESVKIYPANIFVTTKERIHGAIREIQLDLGEHITYFNSIDKTQEAARIKQRVEYDLEMIKELGYCSGIENYSRYFDGRKPGSRPFCLLDYFPDDFLTIIDESHVTIGQVRAMYGGDASRKQNLVEYGFRLPAAKDNRPLTFDEFEGLIKQVIYVSATPADYELIKSEGMIIEQIIRPTGLLDPHIDVRKTENQIDNLVEEIALRAAKDQRILVTTLTKNMAEELDKHFQHIGIRSRYIHSDVDTLERVEILDGLRAGMFDVLIGVNLLREGLDLPEVSLVAILDADKEGFLRSDRALTQTAGRAARNIEGRVIMYADNITDSMRRTLNETARRRSLQQTYNRDNGITPRQIVRNNPSHMTISRNNTNYTREEQTYSIAAEPKVPFNIDQAIASAKAAMEKAAKELDFMAAAKFRDEMYDLQAKKSGKQIKE